MEPTPNIRKRQIIATLAVLILVVVIVGGITIASKKAKNTASMSAGSTSSGTNSTASTTSSSTATFKDGTYTANGSYSSPGGSQSIAVSITLKDGVVTDTSVTPDATDAESSEYQEMFVNGYKQYVVGKKITEIQLSRVSGSSLTSQGFNAAIQKIETEAAA